MGPRPGSILQVDRGPVMEFRSWEPFYIQILTSFGFDPDKDMEAGDLLRGLMKDKNLVGNEKLERTIKEKKVFIFGGGPSLKTHVREYDFPGVLVAADQATTALVERDMRPDIIVTDLDGNVDEQIEMNRQGTIVMVHAHGDNIPALKEHVPRFTGPLVPTCQTRPVPPLHNYGGFTDGDRAVFLADHFKARSIMLVGWDLREETSAYKDMDTIKLKKLDWAYMLLGVLDNPAIQFINEVEELKRPDLR